MGNKQLIILYAISYLSLNFLIREGGKQRWANHAFSYIAVHYSKPF